jgi:hypothetical protein
MAHALSNLWSGGQRRVDKTDLHLPLRIVEHRPVWQTARRFRWRRGWSFPAMHLFDRQVAGWDGKQNDSRSFSLVLPY